MKVFRTRYSLSSKDQQEKWIHMENVDKRKRFD